MSTKKVLPIASRWFSHGQSPNISCLCRTIHPPGGATALIAVIGSGKIHALDYFYVIVPAGIGALAMLIVALLINNIPKTRKYPKFWI